MATVPTTRTRPQGPARGSQDIARALSALERLVEQQVKYMQVITKQEQHLSALRKQTDLRLLLDPKHTQFQDTRKSKREIREQWHNEILEWDPLDNWLPGDDRNFSNILLGEQLWTTWQYQAAYPNTAKFLAKATPSEKSRSLVYYDSFFPTGEIVEQWSSERPYAGERESKRPMAERMWEILKRRVVVDGPGGDGGAGEHLPSRVLRITDVSPVVAAILLASTPKSVVSNISPFLERHLTFSNFGKVSMQSIRSKTVNSYIFEYHFAFYYVTKDPLETHLAYTDVRKLRKFSWFGQRPDKDACSRHIYEEQMSFILTGHGHDIYTCYQLGEKYFNGPKSDELRTFVNSPTWTPSTMFLSWIAMALHHVTVRWQDAIAAVDAQIASEEAVVFHQVDNFDLETGAKDLNISKLRTYFWALEAYKLFEETLEKTVDAWEQFKRHSLNKANDGRDPEDYSKSVEFIELSVARLQGKIDWIRKKSEQVLRLRDGLFYVTSLSDTSVTIRQGENIKLLTYFTILFLPLSFSTSIFGMQFVDKTTAMKTFTVVLPVITVSTLLAVFILTGALQDMQRTISEKIPNPGQKLHELMLEHPRKRWRKEQVPTSRVPVKMPGEQLNLWTYLAFLAELCFISIPVREVKEAINLCKLRNQRPAPSKEPSISMSHLRSNTTLASSHRPDIGEAKSKTLAREVIDFQREIRSSRKRLIPRTARRARAILFNTGRILLLCVWIPLLLLEYVVLLFCWPFMGHAGVPVQHDPPLRVSKREQLKHFFTAPFEFLDLDLYQSLTRRRRGGHEHRSPLPPAGRFDHTLEPLPHSYLYPDPAAGDRSPGPGREPRMALAQRLRRVMARPTFQAAYQQQYHSGTNPVAV